MKIEKPLLESRNKLRRRFFEQLIVLIVVKLWAIRMAFLVQAVVLNNEQQIKKNRKEAKTKLCWVTKN